MFLLRNRKPRNPSNTSRRDRSSKREKESAPSPLILDDIDSITPSDSASAPVKKKKKRRHGAPRKRDGEITEENNEGSFPELPQKDSCSETSKEFIPLPRKKHANPGEFQPSPPAPVGEASTYFQNLPQGLHPKASNVAGEYRSSGTTTTSKSKSKSRSRSNASFDPDLRDVLKDLADELAPECDGYWRIGRVYNSPIPSFRFFLQLEPNEVPVQDVYAIWWNYLREYFRPNEWFESTYGEDDTHLLTVLDVLYPRNEPNVKHTLLAVFMYKRNGEDITKCEVKWTLFRPERYHVEEYPPIRPLVRRANDVNIVILREVIARINNEPNSPLGYWELSGQNTHPRSILVRLVFPRSEKPRRKMSDKEYDKYYSTKKKIAKAWWKHLNQLLGGRRIDEVDAEGLEVDVGTYNRYFVQTSLDENKSVKDFPNIGRGEFTVKDPEGEYSFIAKWEFWPQPVRKSEKTSKGHSKSIRSRSASLEKPRSISTRSSTKRREESVDKPLRTRGRDSGNDEVRSGVTYNTVVETRYQLGCIPK